MLYIFTFLIAISLGGIGFFAKKRNLLKLWTSSFDKKSTNTKTNTREELFTETKNPLLSDLKTKEGVKKPKPQTASRVIAGGEDYWIGLISADPKNPEHYKRLGEWYADNKKRKEAEETLKYALKLDPKDSKIKRKLAKLEK